MDAYAEVLEAIEDCLQAVLEAVIVAKGEPERVRALEGADAHLRAARRELEQAADSCRLARA